ncbi:MAG: hypothetical protein IJ024_00450 [Lachnospiraceae bacterium]|nr:hypothetical protein [Lachnospiraceae bacterium]
MITGLIILAVLVVLFALVLLAMWLRGKKLDEMYPDTVEKVPVSKNDDFQAILKKFNVPEEYTKIVISQARTYNVVNCPAVIWKAEDKLKVLVLKSQPFLAEEEIEDFKYIVSSPFINFRQFDGTEFPDWAGQTDEIKSLFLPYVEMTTAPGGIDRTRQQYWAGTICVYAPSLAEIFKMMGNPLSDYEITVDNPKRMREDGSIPAEMLAQRDAEKKAAAEEAAAAEKGASAKEIDAVWEAIKRLENQNKDEISAEDVNKLNAYLISEKRFDDLERSTQDKEFQKELFKEFKNK